MTVLSADKRAELEAKKTKLEALYDKAYASYEAALESSAQSYRFDSGEGSQSVTKRSLKELTDTMEHLEAQIDHIDRRLNGKLVVNLDMRRKEGTGFRRRFGY